MRKERADLQQGASLAPAEEDPYASLNPLLDQLTAIQKMCIRDRVYGGTFDPYGPAI